MPGNNPDLSSLQFGLLPPADTPLLVRLVQDCYGDSYAHGYFYDAAALRQLIEQGLLYCAVARDAQGRVVAHMAVKLEYPEDRTADNFAGMMLPAYRGRGVLMQLGTLLLPVYQRLQLYALQTATVTHHTISQKISSNTGTVTVGCLLADSPGSNAEGLQIPHRMPILMQCYPLHTAPARKLFAPVSYLPLLHAIYSRLAFPVAFADGVNPIMPGSTTEQRMDQRRGTALLRFHTIGTDFAAQVTAFEHETHGMQASYIDVPLTDVAAPFLIAIANSTGWFFGGVLPGRAGTDFLRLQRCALPPAASRTGIVDAVSREMLEQILRDHDRVNHRSLA